MSEHREADADLLDDVYHKIDFSLLQRSSANSNLPNAAKELNLEEWTKPNDSELDSFFDRMIYLPRDKSNG
jgi:hypothetical protein